MKAIVLTCATLFLATLCQGETRPDSDYLLPALTNARHYPSYNNYMPFVTAAYKPKPIAFRPKPQAEAVAVIDAPEPIVPTSRSLKLSTVRNVRRRFFYGYPSGLFYPNLVGIQSLGAYPYF